MTVRSWGPILEGLPGLEVRWNESLSRHTTFRVGGETRCLVRPETEDALIRVIERARRSGIPYVVLGGGSNVLAPDDSLDLMVIQLVHCSRDIARTEGCGSSEATELSVGAGVPLRRLLRFCLQERLGGLEFMVGIPGTVGGALVMNAGTGDRALADVLTWIQVLDEQGRRRRLERKDLAPAYRSMRLSKDWIVLRGGFIVKCLQNGDLSRQALSEKMRLRRASQPLGLPSAGCIFKNPPGFSAGFLIDRAGLKGFRVGDAQVSEKHANWIVNHGNARARDILDLIEHIEKLVLEEFGVCLEREIQIL
jgi:UDP-N-acetylmuramate dehydrogenase